MKVTRRYYSNILKMWGFHYSPSSGPRKTFRSLIQTWQLPYVFQQRAQLEYYRSALICTTSSPLPRL
jgi:hypothetical protein